MSRILDRRMMQEELRIRVQAAGGIYAASRLWGISPRDIDGAIAGVLSPTGDLLKAIGLREEVTYIAER